MSQTQTTRAKRPLLSLAGDEPGDDAGVKPDAPRESPRPEPQMREPAAEIPAEPDTATNAERDRDDGYEARPTAPVRETRLKERRTPRRVREERSSEAFEPLIDPQLVFASIWNWRRPIVLLTVAGLAVGTLVALSTPHKYTAVASLLVDPRELKLVDRDIAPDYLANEAALAIVDSQLALVRSSAVIGKVVERAGLESDPEFNGTGSRLGGVIESVRSFISIFTADDSADDAQRSAARALRDRLFVERSDRTFVIEVGATTRDPEKSARVANELTTAFIEEQEKLHSDTARNASRSLTSRLNALKTDVENADEALQRYKAENGLIGPGGRLVTDDQLTAVTAQLSEARAAKIAAQARVDAMNSANIDSLVSGGVPQRFSSNALAALRAQYATRRQAVASLENQLGPRHPQLADARASLQSIENEINAELRRIAGGARAELQQATQNEQQLSESLARLRAESVGNNDAQIRLRELEREAEAARSIYEAFLRRARETGEIENLDTSNVQVISPAEAPVTPSSLSRKIIVAGFGLGGFLLGIALALLSALRTAFAGSEARGRTEPEAPAPPPAGRRSGEDHDFGKTAASRAYISPAADPLPTSSLSKENESEMYPYRHHPYQAVPQTDPYGQPQRPAMPNPAEQPWQPAAAYGHAPAHDYPQQAYPHHPQPAHGWPHQPEYPPQPYPLQPAPAYGAPYGGYSAQPPMQQMPQQPMPRQHMQPQHMQPQAAPAGPDHYGRPYPEPVRHEPYLVPGQDHAASGRHNDEELQDLRNSVREIRETVEALLQRRSERERWSA